MTTVRVYTKYGSIKVDEVVREVRSMVSYLVSARKRWMVPFTGVEPVDKRRGVKAQ